MDAWRRIRDVAGRWWRGAPGADARAAGGDPWLAAFLDEGRIDVHFQPIVEAIDPARGYGYEVLMRGRGAAGELVPPLALLEAARTAGMLPRLDLHARLVALQQARALRAEGSLFLNFSPLAVGDGRLHLRATTELADALGLARERLVFEVTETDRIADLAAFRAVLEDYRTAGFRIALDDVGSGYSSLGLLDQLRPDFVKIDLGLVRNVHQDPFRGSITAKLLELARGLGITTIAEGVEHVGEWRWLRDQGADLVQGYLFGRPTTPPAAVAPGAVSFLECGVADLGDGAADLGGAPAERAG